MIDVRRTASLGDYAACVVIRYRVFVLDQKVPAEREIDAFEDVAVHYLASRDETPVGTARYRLIDGRTAKIERMAVLPDVRRSGVGSALMQRIIADLGVSPAIATVKGGAQIHALPFYRRFGFRVAGPEYLEVGIRHRDIVLDL